MYLCQDIHDSSKKIALKVFKDEHIREGAKDIKREINILNELDHIHINQLIGHGQDGVIVHESGEITSNVVYMMLEFIPGDLFFYICEALGA